MKTEARGDDEDDESGVFPRARESCLPPASSNPVRRACGYPCVSRPCISSCEAMSTRPEVESAGTLPPRRNGTRRRWKQSARRDRWGGLSIGKRKAREPRYSGTRCMEEREYENTLFPWRLQMQERNWKFLGGRFRLVIPPPPKPFLDIFESSVSRARVSRAVVLQSGLKIHFF